MEKEQHIQWAYYKVLHHDYYISLNLETLNKVKEWSIIKSKIVYNVDWEENTKNMVQKKLFITLLTEEERKKFWRETRVICTNEKVWIKISERLLDILLETDLIQYEHRYDVYWNKIQFYIDDFEREKDRREKKEEEYKKEKEEREKKAEEIHKIKEKDCREKKEEKYKKRKEEREKKVEAERENMGIEREFKERERNSFDDVFQSCERQNKKQPTEWDLFESDYINVYKPKK